MNYMDYYLKFSSKEEANNLLFTVHPAVLSEDSEVLTEQYSTANYDNIDVLGILYEQAPENADADYVAVELEGWYVNVRADAGLEVLEQYKVIPTHARRVWAS